MPWMRTWTAQPRLQQSVRAGEVPRIPSRSRYTLAILCPSILLAQLHAALTPQRPLVCLPAWNRRVWLSPGQLHAHTACIMLLQRDMCPQVHTLLQTFPGTKYDSGVILRTALGTSSTI